MVEGMVPLAPAPFNPAPFNPAPLPPVLLNPAPLNPVPPPPRAPSPARAPTGKIKKRGAGDEGLPEKFGRGEGHPAGLLARKVTTGSHRNRAANPNKKRAARGKLRSPCHLHDNCWSSACRTTLGMGPGHGRGANASRCPASSKPPHGFSYTSLRVCQASGVRADGASGSTWEALCVYSGKTNGSRVLWG